MPQYDVDPSDAIELEHPDNRGLQLYLPSIPAFTGGGRWGDAVRPASGGERITGTPTWRAGPFGGQSLNLAGDPQSCRTRFTGISSHLDNQTIAASVVFSSVSGLIAIVDSSDGSGTGGGGLWVQSSRFTWFGRSTNTVFGSLFTVSIGVPYRVVTVYDAAAYRVSTYVNGRLTNSGTPGGTATWVTGLPWRVSGYANTTSFPFLGSITDVRISGGIWGASAVARDFEHSSFRPYWEDPRIRTLRGLSVFPPMGDTITIIGGYGTFAGTSTIDAIGGALSGGVGTASGSATGVGVGGASSGGESTASGSGSATGVGGSQAGGASTAAATSLDTATAGAISSGSAIAAGSSAWTVYAGSLAGAVASANGSSAWSVVVRDSSAATPLGPSLLLVIRPRAAITITCRPRSALRLTVRPRTPIRLRVARTT
jgi:hypothetical protein